MLGDGQAARYARLLIDDVGLILVAVLGVGGVCLFWMQDENGEGGLHAIVETTDPIDSERLAVPFRAKNIGDVRVHFIAALPRNTMGKLMRRDAKAVILQRL